MYWKINTCLLDLVKDWLISLRYNEYKMTDSQNENTGEETRPSSETPDQEQREEYPKKEEPKKDEIYKKIKSSFDLFQNNGTLSADDLGTFVRSLDLNPTEEQISKMIDEFGVEYIMFDKLEPVMRKIMTTHMYQDELLIKHSEETILRAFEELDTEKKGYIPIDKLTRLLKTYGEAFDDEEMKEMIQAAQDDPDSDVIYYADYAAHLANE